jgi:hypothetical protein
MQQLLKGFRGKKDNPTRIDRETKMDREIRKLRFYYIYTNLWGYVCKTYLTFKLALKQRSKSNMCKPHKEHQSSHSGIAITKNLIRLVDPDDLFS